jgi:hypothetical protein
MNIKEMVSDNKKVTFEYYRDNELWYKTENDFLFPVPTDDVGNAVFMKEDKALLFMRWIRKHIQKLEDARKNQNL